MQTSQTLKTAVSLSRNQQHSTRVNLTSNTLEDIKTFVDSTIRLTYDRIRMLRSAKREEPHIKLLIIDLINYLMGLLSQEERTILISELHEQQLGLDGQLDQDSMKEFINKEEDLDIPRYAIYASQAYDWMLAKG